MTDETEQQFQRKGRKSLSQKRNPDEFDPNNKNMKRYSQLPTKIKIIPEFDNIDRTKLHSRSSLPTELKLDKSSSRKNSNLDENNLDKRSSNSKEFNSSIEKLSLKGTSKNKIFLDSFQGGIKDIRVVWKNKNPDKEEEKEQNILDKQYDNIENFLSHLNEKYKATENIEVNYSSSTLGYTGSKKSFSKSDDKNTKINLKNIIHNEKSNLKKNLSHVILSDINHAENKENKLDILIKTMDEYKDIIMEKMLCKNFQDRLMLNIFICLSQLSFKLYNCVDNKTKFENLRKYICSLTDDIKYNINNPNFTISLINQKLIDIDSIEKDILINSEDDIKENDNNPININANDSSLNLVSRTNKNINSSQNSKSNSDTNEIKNNFFNFFEEEIIYENFEEFNNDTGSDKDIYVNPNLLYEIDTKDNPNYFEQNAFNKQNGFENNALYPIKSVKSKARRNATYRMLLKKKTTKSSNVNNTTNNYINTNNYDFHIIDINGKNDIKETSDDSIDSDEDCIEVTETYKFERQKLLFYEDYIKDKDKRRVTKIDSIEVKPDKKFLDNKERLAQLNEVSYKNIIDIIHDDPSVLPNHQLNMNPIAIANFIKEKEKILNSEKESEKEEEENEEEVKSFFNSDDSSSVEESENKQIKRFGNINKEVEKENNEEEEEEKDNDDDNNNSEKTWKSRAGENNQNHNIKFLEFDNEDDEDDEIDLDK